MRVSKKLIVFLVLSILGISFSFYAYQVVYTPNILVDREDRVLIIPNDATFKSVQQQLHEGRYINDLISFSFLARLMNYDRAIKPGRYVLRSGMSNMQAIRLLRSGNQVPVSMRFHNVRTLDELPGKITDNLMMTPPAFDSALMRFVSVNPYGFNKDNVIAMFIPNTYQVYYDVSPDDLIERMHQEYENFWSEENLALAAKTGLTPVEISILASIVQAETIKADEAPVIAGLYLNRLKKGIALQADPTLKFALRDFTIKRILNVHKEVDSPYNTYTHAGLPPGPINMPEIASLQAVLNYTPSDYLYMCAKEDFSGSHNFTGSYQEHLRNAIRYQTALTREQRKAAAQRRGD
ncbi:MAG TPA: endolytic transglycosylase MltG [Cyclobacteriaceae bacterium]